jgi:hypothetical protein
MNSPKIGHSQIVFGDIIYWVTVVAALLCMIGPALSFAAMGDNLLNPHHLFSQIWSGADPASIWATAGGGAVEGRNWLYNFAGGDGITQIGLIIGCSVALPAMVAAALIFIFKEKTIGWALGALWIAGLVTISIIGVASLHG